VLIQAEGDPLVFARVGQGFADGQPVGDPGYDGQFAYAIALDPRPSAAAAHLDVPAYRYQRILHPLLARLLALGQPGLIAWTLLITNIAAHLGATWLLEQRLSAGGVSAWPALVYGLWAGLLLAVRLDLSEPLAFALVLAGLAALDRGRAGWAAASLALAMLAKETTLVFCVAGLGWAVVTQRWRTAAWLGLPLAAFAAWQACLAAGFGAPGLGAGGYLATQFEWVPFMGLWRIGSVSPPALALYLSILGPLVVLPAGWGVAAALRRLWARRDAAVPVLALALNAGLLWFTPFSTFREPVGMVRLATGLVLSTLLYGAHTRSRRVLALAWIWLSALALLVRD
jgi:hypothetical protein